MTLRFSIRPFLRVVIAAAGQYFVGVTGGQALDYNCARAPKPAERTICSSPELSRLDERMARSYGRLWEIYGNRRATDWDRVSLRATQREFLAARDTCADEARCIRDAYQGQIGVLDRRIHAAAR